jgi:hypothetical protein
MIEAENNSKLSMQRSYEGNHMARDYQIHLNFLPIIYNFPPVTVHRKLQAYPQETKPNNECFGYHLPVNPKDKESWPLYWVTIDPTQGFEPFEVAPALNRDLTCRVLFWSLLAGARRILQPDNFFIPKNRFIQEISFLQRRHTEGAELLVVQPYNLRATGQFGFLVDFHFRMQDGVLFSRKVQRLSLSLDKGFHRNLDYYMDRSSKVMMFLKERQDVFKSLSIPGSNEMIKLADEFVTLPADRLKTKRYVFAGNNQSKSQFNGLRDYGPLKQLDGPIKLLFVFREQDRQAARTLAISLRGNRQRGGFTFPGFNALFNCKLEIDGNPVILPELSQQAIEGALQRVIIDKQTYPNIVPVVVLPSSDDSYLVQKALFTQAGIPTQVCTLPILQNEDALKWAIANLALQIFCKAGGYPWKVQPTSERSLIIGISQSHKIRKEECLRSVEKYFAFSVMTDSSGLFQKIQVLGEDSNEGDYLIKLRQGLREALKESAEHFSRVVVHTSFKLKHREIDAIQMTVKSAAATAELTKCNFAVIKVNHKSRFFGVNRGVNSLVPFEATSVKLGPREYLVWFEGIFPDRPTVTKAFPGPTHLQILRAPGEKSIPDEILLQDLVNLSGANWRGFNAKSAPVSVFYCHLVADLVHNFHERGLPLPAVKDIKPWFL